MKIISKISLLIFLASMSLSLPAGAAEVPDVVRVFLDIYKTQWQAEPTYAAISETAGDIVIDKLSVVKPAANGQPGMTMTVEKVVLGDVSDEGNGLYEIGRATASGTKLEVKGAGGTDFTVDVPESSVKNWYLQDPGENPTPATALRAALTVAEEMSSGPMTLTAMGQTITSQGYTMTWDGDPATGAGAYAAKLATVVIPESLMALIDPSGALKQLGYSGLTFDIEGNAKVDIAADKLGFDGNFAYIGKDMGALKFSIAAGDIPVALFSEIQKAEASGKEPDYTTLMPQLQNVTLGGFTFRFEDNSITKKLLPLMAAAQGTDEATMVASAGAMLQLSLMQLKNQAFTDQVVAAVNRFLRDPQSITVALKPAAPIKVQELMALNPAAPGDAIDKLGVSVSAND